jgi:DNA-binding GntR family transcriptional regulator
MNATDMLQIETIEHPPGLYATAYEQLRKMILDGRLAAGTRIDEEAFCRAFGISRTPLREALHRLDHDGLATIWPRHGAFVTDFTKAQVIDLLELRVALEGFAARLAAERADAEAQCRLRALVNSTTLRQLSLRDPRRLADLDREFHELVYEATGNEQLIANSRRINDQVHLVRLTTTHLNDRRTQSARELARIVAAITGRRAAEAEELAREHVTNAIEAVRSSFPDGATLSTIAHSVSAKRGL